MCTIVTQVPAMLAHERVGNADNALACAEIILGGDRPQGGTESKRQHSSAHACRGRILAAQDQADEAEAAFKSAAEAAEAIGHHFLTSIALRDLCKHVLDGAGRGEEGQTRLEVAVSRLACSVEDLDGIVYPRAGGVFFGSTLRCGDGEQWRRPVIYIHVPFVTNSAFSSRQRLKSSS